MDHHETQQPSVEIKKTWRPKLSLSICSSLKQPLSFSHPPSTQKSLSQVKFAAYLPEWFIVKQCNSHQEYHPPQFQTQDQTSMWSYLLFLSLECSGRHSSLGKVVQCLKKEKKPTPVCELVGFCVLAIPTTEVCLIFHFHARQNKTCLSLRNSFLIFAREVKETQIVLHIIDEPMQTSFHSWVYK